MTITIPSEVEAGLDAEARRLGTTAELLAVDTLRRTFVPPAADLPAEGETLLDFLGDFVGSIDGPSEPLARDGGRIFAEALEEKRRNAGL
jgi:hypothetical protein